MNNNNNINNNKNNKYKEPHSDKIDSNEINIKHLEELIIDFVDLKNFKKSICDLYNNCNEISGLYDDELNEYVLEEIIHIDKEFKNYQYFVSEFEEKNNPVLNDLLNKYYILNPKIKEKIKKIKKCENDFEKIIISKYISLEQRFIRIQENLEKKKIDIVTDNEEFQELKTYFKKLTSYNKTINKIKINIFNNQSINTTISSCDVYLNEIEKVNIAYEKIKSILEHNKNLKYELKNKNSEYILNKLPLFRDYFGNKNIIRLLYSLKDKKFPVGDIFEMKNFRNPYNLYSFFNGVDKTSVKISHILSVFIGMSIMGTIIGFGQCDYNEMFRQNYLNKYKQENISQKDSTFIIEKEKLDSINKESKNLENSIEGFYYNEEHIK